MFTRALFLCGFVVLAFTAQAQTPRVFPSHVEWRLVSINAAPARSPDPASLRIEAEGGRAFGSTGCNRWMGAITGIDERLRFSPLAVTRRYCAGAEGEIERQFVAVLNAAPLWRLQRGALVLTSGKTRLRFRRAG
jgi:heat shock protein HslJ